LITLNVFGFETLARLGLVWDIAKTSNDGSTLTRCSWTASSAAEQGATPYERVRRGGAAGRASCYKARRVAVDGRVTSGLLREMQRATGSSVGRFE